ncbi:phospholipid/cholesterol/gamma-HCH transport system substrate-binding protein [Nocardia tenerifensis]|uniref:Phospholipid/cholesterol/gamma-HCH transport system substrate-binding protein n=2 Tax=Nocardia tenerifensis TaxID=228006 RepID=A0A318JLS1_9NOCA|nr:phospholipid/cholesterol/gamma-HCH transport system substrate-binding protein [Nocardia tenerifensis]
MRVLSRTGSVAAAVVVTVAVVVGVSGASWVDRVRPTTQRVCAEFTDTVGLYEGNSVTVLGVEVGTVSGIEARGDRMRVTMTIDGTLDLPADITAVTISSSIVTDRHVELAKTYTGGPKFDTARCIPLERTKTPVGISEALDAIARLAGDLLGAQQSPTPGAPSDTLLDQTLTGAVRALDGTGPQWNALLQRLSQVIGDPADRDGAIRRLVDNLDQLTTMFITNWPDMQALLDNLKNGIQLVDGFSAQLSRAVDLALEFLPVIARNVGKYDQQSYDFLDRVVPEAHRYAVQAGGIVDLLVRLPPLTDRLVRVFDPANGSVRVNYAPPQYESVDGSQTGLARVILGSLGAR